MTARRMVLLAVLLAMASVSAWGQVGPFTITPTSLPVGGGVFVIGQAIPVQQLGTTPPLDQSFAWTISSGSLPPGLALDPFVGSIQGTPTKEGAFTFTVFCQEVGTVFTASQQYTLFISLGTFTLTPLAHPQAAAGVFYLSQTFQVAGGVPGYTWSLQNGATADGLAISTNSSILFGTPLKGGIIAIGVTVTDAAGAQISASFDLNVLGVATTSLANGSVGLPYSGGLMANGASGTLTWAVTSTVLPPPGITLSAQGLFSGTPTSTGTFPFVVRVTDSATNLSSSSTLSITVLGTLTITTTSLPGGAPGMAYSQTLAATGSTNPLTWSLSGTGRLPPGLNISAQGVIAGTPTQAGAFPFQVQVSDSVTSLSAVQSLNITVAAAGVTITGTLPNGVVNIPYSAPPLTVSGAANLTWVVTVGTLPAGLNLNAATGVVSGTPTAAGSSTFTISATPGGLPPVVQQFTIVIGPVTLTFTQTPAASLQVALSGAIAAPISSPISGTLTLTFTSAEGVDDPNIQFLQSGAATGSRQVAFTIPANSTTLNFSNGATRIAEGTVAGTITVTTVLQSGGTTLTPPAPLVITINPSAPVVTGVTIGAITSTGFSISVTGYSTTRDMTSGQFHFAFPSNSQPPSADVTVPLTSAFTTWYSGSASNPFGSQFLMTVQFTFKGPAGTTVPFIAVTTTLTNSKGTSNAFGPVNP